VGLFRARIRKMQVGLRRGPPEAHLETLWKINARVGLVGLVGLFLPYTCARTRAREDSREKANQPHKAHLAEEIRGFQAVGLQVGLETEAHLGPTAIGRS
jgi:hypothetical protein